MEDVERKRKIKILANALLTQPCAKRPKSEEGEASLPPSDELELKSKKLKKTANNQVRRPLTQNASPTIFKTLVHRVRRFICHNSERIIEEYGGERYFVRGHSSKLARIKLSMPRNGDRKTFPLSVGMELYQMVASTLRVPQTLVAKTPPITSQLRNQARDCFHEAMGLIAHLLRLDMCSLLSERLYETCPSRMTTAYASSITTKCAKLAVEACKTLCRVSHTRMAMTLGQIRRLKDVIEDSNTTNKTILKYSNGGKLHAYMRSRIKRSHLEQVNNYLTDRVIGPVDDADERRKQKTKLGTAFIALPGINYARKAALHNIAMYRIANADLLPLIIISLAEYRRQKCEEQSYSERSLAELDLENTLISTVCHRLRVKPLITNEIRCTCHVKCYGWDTRKCHGVLQTAISHSTSILICRQCALSPNTKNKKASRVKLRINNTNPGTAACSICGSISMQHTELYSLNRDAATGDYEYKQLFHSTNSVNLMNEQVSRIPSGPGTRFHGVCYGGRRKCMKMVRVAMPSSKWLKEAVCEAESQRLGRTLTADDIKRLKGNVSEVRYASLLSTQNHTHLQYFFARAERVLMCRTCIHLPQHPVRPVGTPVYSECACQSDNSIICCSVSCKHHSEPIQLLRKHNKVIFRKHIDHKADFRVPSRMQVRRTEINKGSMSSKLAVSSAKKNWEEAFVFSGQRSSLRATQATHDKDTCVETLLQTFNIVFREAERSGKHVDLSLLAGELKSFICDGCLVRLSCHHLAENFSCFLRETLLAAKRDQNSWHNTQQRRTQFEINLHSLIILLTTG